jgi:flavin reductase
VALSDDAFRRVMRRWASGVTVVTVRHEEHVRAMLVTSFLSVSLDPPLILVSIKRGGDTHRLLEASQRFAVNILHDGHADLANRLGYLNEESARSLRTVPFHSGVTGAPILDDCLAYLDCRVVEQHEATDHTLYVGQVEDGAERDGYPLMHWERAFHRLERNPRPAQKGSS